MVNRELDRLTSKTVIAPVDYSDWAAPIVVVKKPSGEGRVCGDYSTGLNAAFEPNHYLLPLPDDIFAKLAGCMVFAVIDFSDAYLQVEVDDNSKMLLTIHTHRGLYKFNRLPPGVRSAPGEFQRIMDQLTAGLTQTCAYLDDVIVGAPSATELNERIRAVLTRTNEYGFHLRIDKCKFGLMEITYLGHVISANGIRPDPRKTEAISRMCPPSDVSTLRAFLGAVNFYGKFVKEMHALRQPLDALLKADAKFKWTADCQKAFDEFKRILQSDLLLAHYDPRYPIIVAADASSTGIGACIMHRYPDGKVKVVQHASRTLTAAERNYSQIEKEACGLIFAVTKFHRMVAGRHFTLQTDHQPLLAIFGSRKGIPVHTANRLQRWATTLMAYDFDIEYVRTDKFGYADVLSRLISSHIQPDEEYVVACIQVEKEMSFIVDEAANHMPIDFETVRHATLSDPLLTRVKNFIRDGWPDKPNFTDDEIRTFFNRRNALTVHKDVVLFADRIVVPPRFRRRILQQLHVGHPGIPRMKNLARSFVYWPKIDQDIKDFVRKCNDCASNANMPVKTHLQSWPTPVRPWQRIHVDYCGPLQGLYFFVVVDAHSKWPEIFSTRSTTSSATIELLQKCFDRFGIVNTIVSDNGTQFKSAQFRQFCESLGIEHITTAPFHPQSNGQAERFVGTFKAALRKIQKGEKVQEAMSIFLRCYRSTPNPNCPDGKSPAEVMLGRKMRTKLDLLLPPTDQDDHADYDRQARQNDQFDRKHGAVHRSFQPGDLVFARVFTLNDSSWRPGVIIDRIGKVMYSVKLTRSGRQTIGRFHTNQLKIRYSDGDVELAPLPLDILIDTFHIRDAIPDQADEQPPDAVPAPSADVTLPPTPVQPPVQQPDARPRQVRTERPVSRREPRPQRQIIVPSKFNNYVLY
jgi:transposase InsO family protein